MVIFFKLAFVHCAELSSVYFLLSFLRLFQEALHYQKHHFTLCLYKVLTPLFFDYLRSSITTYMVSHFIGHPTSLLHCKFYSRQVFSSHVNYLTMKFPNNPTTTVCSIKNVTLLWLLLTYNVYPMFKFLISQLQVESLFLRHFLVY